MSGLLGGGNGLNSGVIGNNSGRMKFGRDNFGAQSTGTIQVTGVTFRPSKLLVFSATVDSMFMSVGFASNEGVGNEGDATALGFRAKADDNWYKTSAVASGFGAQSGEDDNFMNVTFTSFDPDGFTLTRDVNGNPGDSPMHIAWIAFE